MFCKSIDKAWLTGCMLFLALPAAAQDQQEAEPAAEASQSAEASGRKTNGRAAWDCSTATR